MPNLRYRGAKPKVVLITYSAQRKYTYTYLPMPVPVPVNNAAPGGRGRGTRRALVFYIRRPDGTWLEMRQEPYRADRGG